jgi:hypothetical protein
MSPEENLLVSFVKLAVVLWATRHFARYVARQKLARGENNKSQGWKTAVENALGGPRVAGQTALILEERTQASRRGRSWGAAAFAVVVAYFGLNLLIELDSGGPHATKAVDWGVLSSGCLALAVIPANSSLAATPSALGLCWCSVDFDAETYGGRLFARCSIVSTPACACPSRYKTTPSATRLPASSRRLSPWYGCWLPAYRSSESFS